MATAGQAQVLETTTDEVVNTVVDADTSVAPTRYFTVPGIDPFDAIEWELRDAHIPGRDGPTFEQKDVESRKASGKGSGTSSTSAGGSPRRSASRA